MKTAFIFDTFLLKENNNYYGMTLTYDFFSKRYLDKFGYIRVITRFIDRKDYKGNSEGYRIVNGVNVDVSPVSYYKQIPDIIKNKKKIYKELEQKLEGIDRVIIRMPSVLGIIAASICKKKKKKYMIEMVACPWDGYNNHSNIFGKLIAPFMYFSTKKVCYNADLVLYVTNEFLQSRYPTKGLSYGCSDVEIINDSINVEEKYKDFKLNTFTMATIANIEMKYKGHIYAFKAIKELKKQNVSIKYFLVGNGNKQYLLNKAKKLNIQDNIVFLGSLTHEEVFKALDKIDIYIQPSLQEGLPRALVEAMSRGCACIGSNVGGIPELLDNKMIFKRKKHKEIVNIVNNLTNEKVIAEAKANLKKSEEFNSRSLNEKRNQIYNKFVQE